MFRKTLGKFATGVGVLITMGPHGPHGMTINSFTSVSLNPPLILFCADQKSRTWSLIDQHAPPFTISFLSEHQQQLSRTFADPRVSDAAFDQVSTKAGAGQALYLADALAYLECSVHATYPGGDHYIVVGRVNDFQILQDGQPLIFFSGGYGHFRH